MFNLQGGELLIILVLALVVLGPEKLPEAMRRVGRAYAELRRMGAGFTREFRDAVEEPANDVRRMMRETVETVDGVVRSGDPTVAGPDPGPTGGREPGDAAVADPDVGDPAGPGSGGGDASSGPGPSR